MVEELDQRILFEDNHLIILNKRCGELAQGDKTGDSPLIDQLREFIRVRDRKPGNAFLGLVHRLDRPTSGVLVFAKTSKGLSRMNALFQQGGVQKSYWALVEGELPHASGELCHYLVKDQEKNRSRAFDMPGHGRKEARLRYFLLHRLERYSLLEIQLLTGRHHQIRAQLAAIGLHIRGDLKYGAARSNPQGGISLHAAHISFVHPVRDEEVSVYADPRPVQDDQLWKNPDLYTTIERAMTRRTHAESSDS